LPSIGRWGNSAPHSTEERIDGIAQIHHRAGHSGGRQPGARAIAGRRGEVERRLARARPDIQWVESYVAADKTFCVYLAKDEAIIRKHAEISGFPATKITEVRKMIDPTTEHAA
jgi:hypothetical protein